MNSTAVLAERSARAGLSAIPVFSQLADEILKTIAEAGSACTFAAGDFVFRDGDPGDCLYSVLSGELRVFKQFANGTQIEIGRLRAGDSFGEIALLDGGPRSNTVQALTSCHLFSLGRDAFLDALPDSPKLVAAVLGSVASHVRASSEYLLRQELEQRAVRAEMEAERLRALTQMVAGVAHEINTPLGIVNTAASIVGQRIGSPLLTEAVTEMRARAHLEDIREAAELIQANVQRAHKLVESFKQLSCNQITNAKETLRLPEVIDDAIGLFAINARQAHLDIRVSNTIADGSSLSWTGYRGLLTQVILNLLTNIERDGSGGRIDISIGELFVSDDPHFTITVRDYGRGMSPESVSRVFEPFYTTGRARGGTGLGMAIVHNLVTSALKGQIELASEPGGGTAVTMAIPKRIPDLAT
jgi:signal transduction histidine kinase